MAHVLLVFSFCYTSSKWFRNTIRSILKLAGLLFWFKKWKSLWEEGVGPKIALTSTWVQKKNVVSQQHSPKPLPCGVRGKARNWEWLAQLAYSISWLIFVCNNCIKKIMRVGFFLVLPITMANMLRRFRQKCDFTSNDNYFWTEL